MSNSPVKLFDTDPVADRAIKTIQTYFHVSTEITLFADLKDGLGFDSLDIIEMIMALEDEFGIEIDDSSDEVIAFKAVQDYVTYIKSKVVG